MFVHVCVCVFVCVRACVCVRVRVRMRRRMRVRGSDACVQEGIRYVCKYARVPHAKKITLTYQYRHVSIYARTQSENALQMTSVKPHEGAAFRSIRIQYASHFIYAAFGAKMKKYE